MTPRHTHVLVIPDDALCDLDPFATALALMSGGVRVLEGADAQAERDCLAAVLADLETGTDSMLVRLLISGRPMRAYPMVSGYVFEEL